MIPRHLCNFLTFLTLMRREVDSHNLVKKGSLIEKIIRISAVASLFFVLLTNKIYSQGFYLASFNINETNFLSRVFQIAFGVGVGSGIILIGVGGLTIASAAGDPEKINQGRDQIVSALIGLTVVVFSIVILEILGVDLLGLGKGFWNI